MIPYLVRFLTPGGAVRAGLRVDALSPEDAMQAAVHHLYGGMTCALDVDPPAPCPLGTESGPRWATLARYSCALAKCLRVPSRVERVRCEVLSPFALCPGHEASVLKALPSIR